MENKTLIVKLNKNDVYRQLLAMCNDSEDYSLQQGDYKDKELECLSVADRKQITAEKMNIPLRKKILGYIRLLPNNDDTLIAFVHKNRPEWYDHPVINPELWDSFIKAVFGYFKGDLDAPTVDIMDKVSAPRKDANGSAAITLNIIDLVLKGEGKELESNFGIPGDLYRHYKMLYDLGGDDLAKGEKIFRARQEFLSAPTVDASQPLRPDGYEIYADNTQGTAIYKRDDDGKITEQHIYNAAGWTGGVIGDSISFQKITSGTGFTEPATVDAVGTESKSPKDKPGAKARKSKKKIILQTKPAGRKVDKWNPAAFDILYNGEENSDHRAFEYWCKEQGIPYPNARDKGAFKKAMGRELKRRNG